MSPKDNRSVNSKWEQAFMERQRVPGTHAYQCPYCGDITRTGKELKGHLLQSCRRVPASSQLTRSSAQSSTPTSPNEIVRCLKCGRAMKHRQISEHMNEFHTRKPVADPQHLPQVSGAQIREHDSEILRRRAEELNAEQPKAEPPSRAEPPGKKGPAAEYVPCPCGGSNENCSHCFGLGQVRRHHTSLAVHKTNLPTFSARSTASYGKRGLKRAAGKMMTHSPLAHPDSRAGSTPPEEHTGLSRPVNRKQQVQIRVSRPGNSLVQCLVCRKIIRAPILGLHYSARHSGAHNLTKTRQKGQWVICPVCNLSVKRLKKHMRCHDQTALEARTSEKQFPERERLIKLGYIAPVSQSKAVVVQVTRRPQRGARSNTPEVRGRAGALDQWKDELGQKENPNSPRNLDHTRPYAHAARENGRFGSHPSHDGFDDESGA